MIKHFQVTKLMHDDVVLEMFGEEYDAVMKIQIAIL